MRVANDRPSEEGGWVHIGAPVDPRLVERETVRRYRDDCAAIIERWGMETDADHLERHASALGLSVASLVAMGVAWSKAASAWAWPMSDVLGTPIGIRMRSDRDEGADKWAVTGSRAGLFVPRSRSHRHPVGEPLFVCEGPTDTAALLDLGLVAIGRHACSGQHSLVRDYIELIRPRVGVVIVSDVDPKGEGRRGAELLADAIVDSAAWVKVVAPPGGHKDIRRWRRAGATGVAVRAIVTSAHYWRRRSFHG